MLLESCPQNRNVGSMDTNSGTQLAGLVKEGCAFEIGISGSSLFGLVVLSLRLVCHFDGLGWYWLSVEFVMWFELSILMARFEYLHKR
jgi:hypothetical protein